MRFSSGIFMAVVLAGSAMAAPARAAHMPEGFSARVERSAVQAIGLISDGLRGVGTYFGAFEPAAGMAARGWGEPEAAVVALPVLPAPRPAGHGTFDSVAIPVGNVAMSGKWADARARDYRGFFTGACDALGFAHCDSAFGRAMQGAFADARWLSPQAVLGLVNQRVNAAIRYTPDSANWGVADHWATPSQVARNGLGDCEDYAITKMWLLRALGFSEDQLQLVVLQDTRRQLYHAVLAVHVGGERYILDNLSNMVRLDSALPNYMPLVSFVGERNFLHGFEQRRATTANLPADLGAVSPGEGV